MRPGELEPRRALPPQVLGLQAACCGRSARSGPSGAGARAPSSRGRGSAVRWPRPSGAHSGQEGWQPRGSPESYFCQRGGNTEHLHHAHQDPGRAPSTRGAWCGDTWWPPLYCLLWFPQCTFCTIRQHMIFGSFSLSKIKYPGSHEHWALSIHNYRFSPQYTDDSKTRAPGRPAGGGGGRELAWHKQNTDGCFLPAGTGTDLR